MSDGNEQISDQLADRSESARAEEDFEGHKLEGGEQISDQLADRSESGRAEEDFEGHRFEAKLEPKLESRVEE